MAIRRHVQTYYGNNAKDAATTRAEFERSQGRNVVVEQITAWEVIALVAEDGVA